MDAVYGSHMRWSISRRMPFQAMDAVKADRMRHGRHFYTTSRLGMRQGINARIGSRGPLPGYLSPLFSLYPSENMQYSAAAGMHGLCITALAAW